MMISMMRRNPRLGSARRAGLVGARRVAEMLVEPSNVGLGTLTVAGPHVRALTIALPMSDPQHDAP
jgi:hypothetical protein